MDINSDIRKIFSENLRSLLEASGKSQAELARHMGLATASVNDWVRGKKMPRMDKIDHICAFFAVKRSVLLERHNDLSDMKKVFTLPNYVPLQKKKIPLLGKVAAGEPIYADEHIEEYLPVNEDVHADFALRIQGDSMINAGIEDGNIVFVKKQDEVEQGQIAVVLREDSATVKRFYRTENMIQLISENPKYPPIIIQESDFQNVRILGRVTAVLKKL